MSRAPSSAALASVIEASGFRYCAASAAGSQPGSARMASASGSRPLRGRSGARAALGLVGRVQVFQALLGVGGGDFLLQLGRQLALLRDGFQDGAATLFELAQIAQADFQVAQHRVVQAAGGFLAVAGDERHRGAVVQQLDRGCDLVGAHAELGGEQSDDAGVVDAGGDVRDNGSFRHLDTTTKGKTRGGLCHKPLLQNVAGWTNPSL